MQKQVFQDPKIILQTAIEEIDVFTRLEASRLELGENGRLIAEEKSCLRKIVDLAYYYIGPFFSNQLRKEREKRLFELKKAILRARDVIQSHSALIEKFKEGDEAQRKLAESALLTIQRYNAIVAQDTSKNFKSKTYHYERRQLLLDQEIRGRKIECPRVVSVKYESHPDCCYPAHKMLKELSQALSMGATSKDNQSISSTHKKNIPFMIDTFQMKAIRMIETHLQKPIAEIVPLVKQTLPEIDENSAADFIRMQQLIEAESGLVILVTGCFKRNESHSKFLTMPILDSFRLSFQLTHTGFPYPSQHTGWALADQWVEASPLWIDQTPSFQQINQRKKSLAHRLLFDWAFIQKIRQHFKIKRDIFDQNRHIFLPLHYQIQQALHQGVASEEAKQLLHLFYKEVECAPSVFDVLVQTQQQILDIFIKQPIQALEEKWLEAASPLRTGSCYEKFQAACLMFERYRQQVREQFDLTDICQTYVLQQGILLNKAFQYIALQYQSEKMGFPPPFLNVFERKLQACAFQQLAAFLNEYEQDLDVLDPIQIKKNLLSGYNKDLEILQTKTGDENAAPFAIVKELEHYFNSRFYLETSLSYCE